MKWFIGAIIDLVFPDNELPFRRKLIAFIFLILIIIFAYLRL